MGTIITNSEDSRKAREGHNEPETMRRLGERGKESETQF